MIDAGSVSKKNQKDFLEGNSYEEVDSLARYEKKEARYTNLLKTIQFSDRFRLQGTGMPNQNGKNILNEEKIPRRAMIPN